MTESEAGRDEIVPAPPVLEAELVAAPPAREGGAGMEVARWQQVTLLPPT